MKHLTLKEARDRAGLTQRELQERSGVERSRISRLEAGDDPNPTYETVRRLERALRLRRGALVFGEDTCEVAK